jgi:hypothetical protein
MQGVTEANCSFRATAQAAVDGASNGASLVIDAAKPAPPVRRRYDYRCRAQDGCGLEWTRTNTVDQGTINCQCGNDVRWWRSRPA